MKITKNLFFILPCVFLSFSSPTIFLTSCNQNKVKWKIGTNLGNTPSFKLINNWSNNYFSQSKIDSVGESSANVEVGGTTIFTCSVTIVEDFLTIGTSMMNLTDWDKKYGYGNDIALSTAVKDGMVEDIYLGFGQGGEDKELEFGTFHIQESVKNNRGTTDYDIQTVKMCALCASDNQTYTWNLTDSYSDWWLSIVLQEPVQNYFNIRIGNDVHHTATLTSTKQIQFSVKAYLKDTADIWSNDAFDSGPVFSTTDAGVSFTEFTQNDSNKTQCMNIGAINSRTDLPTQNRTAFTPFKPTSDKNFDVVQITGSAMNDDNDYFNEFQLSSCDDNVLYDQDGNTVGTTLYDSTTGFNAAYTTALSTSVTSVYGFVNITDKRTSTKVMCKARLVFNIA
ncbi:MAG: hypothetical protein LBB39_00710 [Mycoplasmataceae bacterium]|nr:hypothetical protein [Mycoplasmataceae bacterium]